MYTQEDLESKSDFELSAEILRSRHGRMLQIWQGRNISSAVLPYSRAVTHKFDINNWSDMGPLIDEIWNELTTVVEVEVETEWQLAMWQYNCGKLRAAAIVYLLIKGGE